MTSFLIISQNPADRQEYILKLCTDQAINPFDITKIQKTTETTIKKTKPTIESKSLGISDIKLMQKKLFLKPLKSKTKAIVIEDAHNLTIEAQNALLKVLEEPPMHSLIILSAETKDVFLPTILSRCKIVELHGNIKELPENEKKEIIRFLDQLPAISISDALSIAEAKGKTKEQSLTWLQNAIRVLHENLTSNVADEKMYHEILYTLSKGYKIIKTTNANPRLTMENLFLAFAEK